MKYILMAAIVAMASTGAMASEFKTNIISSDCTKIAESGNVTGAVVGGATGAVVGHLVSNFFGFGRTARNLTTLGGSIAGGVAGQNVGASRTYNCLVKVQTPTGAQVYAESVGGIRNPGELVTVYSNGSNYLIK